LGLRLVPHRAAHPRLLLLQPRRARRGRPEHVQLPDRHLLRAALRALPPGLPPDLTAFAQRGALPRRDLPVLRPQLRDPRGAPLLPAEPLPAAPARSERRLPPLARPRERRALGRCRLRRGAPRAGNRAGLGAFLPGDGLGTSPGRGLRPREPLPMLPPSKIPRSRRNLTRTTGTPDHVMSLRFLHSADTAASIDFQGAEEATGLESGAFEAPTEIIRDVLVVEPDPEAQTALSRALALPGRRLVGTSSAEGAY